MSRAAEKVIQTPSSTAISAPNWSNCLPKSDLRLDVNIWTKPNLAENTGGATNYDLKKNICNVLGLLSGNAYFCGKEN